MSKSSLTQSSFLGGEWSPLVQGRIDLPGYRIAMALCQNGFPVEEGAWVRRSGSHLISTTRNGAEGRVMDFAFQGSAPYIMELTDGIVRFFAAAPLPQILTGEGTDYQNVTTNDNQMVAGITGTTVAIIQTESAHGWDSGDQGFFLFDERLPASYMPNARNYVYQIDVIDATHFSLVDPLTGAATSAATLGYTSPGTFTLEFARILELVTQFVEGSWSTVRSIQIEEGALPQAILLNKQYNPTQLNVTAIPTSTDFAEFEIVNAVLHDGPYLDPPTDGSTVTPTATSGTIDVTFSSIASINAGAGLQPTDTGRLLRLFSQPPGYDPSTTYTAGEAVTYGDAYYVSLVSSNTGNAPDVSPAEWGATTSVITWTYGVIDVVSAPNACSVIINGPALLNTNPIATWRLGAYSNTTGWPTCGVFYEGRLWLAGAIPNRVDASTASGDIWNMAPTGSDGTVADDNAITYTFNSSNLSPILWMVGQATGIACGTQSGEWLIQASALSDPLTPTSIQAHRVTKYGCADVEPIETHLTTCFVQRFQRKLLEYFPDIFSGRYLAPNLSFTGKHLTTSGIAEIRYQDELAPLIWVRNNDGSLCGLTYKRTSLMSSQAADFVGWHRHVLGSGRLVESIATAPSSDGLLDTLALVTNDPVTDVRHVEVMEKIFDVGDAIVDGFFCDDAIIPTGGLIVGTDVGLTLTFYGLSYLNGKTVSISCGGLDCGDATVSNGSVSVPINVDLNAVFTVDYLTSISDATAYGNRSVQIDIGTSPNRTKLVVPAVIGFTYLSAGRVLRPDTQAQSQTPQGPGFGKKRKSAQFAALLLNTTALSIGTSLGKFRALAFSTAGGSPIVPPNLFSGVYQGTVEDTFSYDGQLAWQIDRPYPCAVCAIVPFLETQEKS